MIKRKITSRIERFYEENKRKALLIDGVRQCGKTYIIQEYGERCYDVFVKVNLMDNADARNIVSTSKNSKELMFRLTSIFGKTLIPGKTLIFFDEIQECADILTFVKFLVEDNRYRYILSGSLLGLELKDVRSVPVGYMDIITMYPVDLEEFYTAVGIPEGVISHVKECFEESKAVDEIIHTRLMDLLRIYMVVGGMPAALDAYIETNDLRRVISIQKEIINLYRMDISKYDPDNRMFIKDVFDRIPAELNKQNKRFRFSSIDGRFRFDRERNTFVWLYDAGVSLPVLNASEPRFPLKASEESSLFKLYLCDIGLLSYQLLDGMQHAVLSGELDLKYGSLFENLIAQELYAHGFIPYYYNNKKKGEVDFLIQDLGKVIPIEAKSGKDYKKHSALNNLLSMEEYGIDKAYVINKDNLQMNGKKIYIPAYMTMVLQKAEIGGEMIVEPNLDGLDAYR